MMELANGGNLFDLVRERCAQACQAPFQHGAVEALTRRDAHWMSIKACAYVRDGLSEKDARWFFKQVGHLLLRWCVDCTVVSYTTIMPSPWHRISASYICKEEDVLLPAQLCIHRVSM